MWRYLNDCISIIIIGIDHQWIHHTPSSETYVPIVNVTTELIAIQGVSDQAPQSPKYRAIAAIPIHSIT